MDGATTLAIVGVLVAFVVVLVVMGRSRVRRGKGLKARFGPEYDRTVEEAGARGGAENRLHHRERRVQKYAIRDLAPADRDSFKSEWDHTQSEFIDDPSKAVAHADQLLGRVMSARGYPPTDFEQRAADLSVDYPVVVQNYRAGHDIAVRHEKDQATTEEMRQAMVHFRSLFEQLTGAAAPARVRGEPA